MIPRTTYSSRSQQEQQQNQQRKMHEMSPIRLSSPPQLPREEWASSASEMALEERLPRDNTKLYSRGNDQEFVFGHDPTTSQWHQQQQQQTRSSPIAIIRNPMDRSSQPEPTLTFDHDDDDDDSSVDVERDALKLKEMYGGDIVASSLKETSLGPRSLLKAPYLGALSQSAPYLSHDIPPISLAEEDHYDPPTELAGDSSSPGVAGYGSLRESHQRGRFLDGPASYRDGRSGQIRPLNYGKRFSHSSVPASISIGERIQKARQEKEQLQKEQKGLSGSGNIKSKNELGVATATSSLSAMMDGVSQKDDVKDQSHASSGLGGALEGAKPAGMMRILMPSQDRRRHSISDYQEDDDDEEDDRQSMMSTSLTGLELLLSTTKRAAAAATQGEIQGGVEEGAQYSHSTFLSPHAFVVNEPPSIIMSGEHQFQALSRSMSDPTPHLKHVATTARQIQHDQPKQRHLLPPPQSSMTTTTTTTSPLGWSPSYNSYSHNGGGGHPASTMQQDSGASLAFGTPASLAGTDPYAMPGSLLNATGAVSTTAHSNLDHNPDTDGAFDMDME